MFGPIQLLPGPFPATPNDSPNTYTPNASPESERHVRTHVSWSTLAKSSAVIAPNTCSDSEHVFRAGPDPAVFPHEHKVFLLILALDLV